MKIGVISDTHMGVQNNARYILDNSISGSPDRLCDIVEPYFKDTEAVIHAGDIIHVSVIDALRRFGDVYAVAGNMDPFENRELFGDKRIIELNGYRIGLIHGWGAPGGLPLRVRQSFSPDGVDCIVFGHSHHPYDRVEDGILMFNPGSPNDKRFAEYRSIGILHLEETIWGEHIRLD